MTTSTTQIDGMEKELLEYYHKNEDRFKKYSNDIDLLKAKLFEGMINDGCFPKRQPRVKRDLTTEYECTQWLSRAAGEQLTFKDFRKMFKSRLKKCELWSEEFYDVCKGIIGDRQNFLDCRKHYEGKKAVLSKNSCKSFPISVVNKKIVDIHLYGGPINIDKDIISKSIGIRKILFLKINGVHRMMLNSGELKKICSYWLSKKINRECNFEDFCNIFYIELSLYDKWSQEWNLVCQKICEEQVQNNYITLEQLNNKELHSNYINLLITLAWIIISFILNPVIYLIFCYAIFVIESFIDIFTVSIGSFIDLPNHGFLLLHEYITNDTLTFWIWTVALTSIPMLFSVFYGFVRNFNTYLKIR